MIEKREQEWLYKRINSLKNRSNKTVVIALFLGLIFQNLKSLPKKDEKKTF